MPSKLVIISNRGPLRSQRTRGRRHWIRSAGGLVTAVDPMIRTRGGTWVCAQEANTNPQDEEIEGPDLGYDLASVRIGKAIETGFYEHVANAVLWPLLHSFPPNMRVGEAPWEDYVAANRAFADAALEVSDKNDLFWVHDYQLMLVPGMLRVKSPSTLIGWFCHVPWPNPDLFSVLPMRTMILEALLGANVLGFHTELYVRNFLRCVERLGAGQVDWARRVVQDRTGHRTKVISAPIGVPVKELSEVAQRPKVRALAEELRRSVSGRQIILGVDRLDYTKGIPERILAFERLLARSSEARKNAVLIQVMVPSRAEVPGYGQLKDEVDRLVGHVNGRFSKTGKVPIHYMYRNLDREMLFAHYLAADVGLITPLRDGMNLVAHEYVVARERGGVLVLSEFAGAAEYLRDAISVNAYDVAEMATTLETALAMSPREQERRMQRLKEDVAELDVHRWADGFLRTLEREG